MTPDNVRRTEIPFRRELRRFAFTERERLVAETVADLTLALGRLVVRVPRLAWLSDLIGLDRPALSRAIRALARARVVSATWVRDELELRPLVDSSTWQERQVLDRETVEAAARRLAAHNAIEQLEIFPAEPDLGAALAEVEVVDFRASGSPSEDRCQIDNVVKSTTAKPEPLSNRQRRGIPVELKDLLPGKSPAAALGTVLPHEHDHDSCNSEGNYMSHVGAPITRQPEPGPSAPPAPGWGPIDRKHKVGELDERTTGAILEDIRGLLPRLDAIHLAHWRSRIERESADLVNAAVRKAQRARAEGRPIRNLAGWLNRVYLSAIQAREKASREARAKSLQERPENPTPPDPFAPGRTPQGGPTRAEGDPAGSGKESLCPKREPGSAGAGGLFA